MSLLSFVGTVTEVRSKMDSLDYIRIRPQDSPGEGTEGTYVILRYQWNYSLNSAEDEIPMYKDSVFPVEEGDLIQWKQISETSLPTIHLLDKPSVPAMSGTNNEVYSDDSSDWETASNHLELKIGMVDLRVAPAQIMVSNRALHEHTSVIRSVGTLKKNQGATQTQIQIQVYFSSADELNDPETGLRGIIAQFRRTPFVPIKNLLLNNEFDITAVALHDIQVDTIPMIPGAAMCKMTLFPFNFSVYLPHALDFNNEINWPLFKWYVKRHLIEPSVMESSEDFKPKLKPIIPEKITDSFFHARIVPEQMYQIQEEYIRNNIRIDSGEFVSAEDKALADRDLEVIERAIDRAKRIAEGQRATINEKDFEISTGLFGSIASPFDLEDGKIVIAINLEHESNKGIGHPIADVIPESADRIHYQNRNPNLNVFLVMSASGTLSTKSVQALQSVTANSESAGNTYKFEEKFRATNSQLMGSYIVEQFMEDYEFTSPEDLIVTGVSVGHNNTFSPIRPADSEWPAFQYMGRQDYRVKMEIEVLSEEALQELMFLFRDTQDKARTYRKVQMAGFIQIKNPIISLFGVDTVIVDTMNVRTVPGFPGRYQVQAMFISMDTLQSTRERTATITKSEDEFIIQRRGMTPNSLPPGLWVSGSEKNNEWANVESLMRGISAYPDLDLPTWEELEIASKKLGIDISGVPWANGIDPDDWPDTGPYNWGTDKYSVFVDPDFYFKPSIHQKRFVAKDKTKEVENVFIVDGQDTEVRRRGEDKIDNAPDALPPIPSKVEENLSNVGDEDIGRGPSPMGIKDQFRGITKDMMQYGAEGRMVRAFPTFHLFFVDEGRWVWWTRLWDNFYGTNAVSRIELFKSRKQPADVLNLDIINNHGTIQDSGLDTRVQGEDGEIKKFSLWTYLVPEEVAISLSSNYREELQKQRSTPRTRITILPGARIHLRMGYGNNISHLPIAFNGTVSNINVGDVTRLQALGDGHELTYPLTLNVEKWSTTKDLEAMFQGEPRETIIRLMLAPHRIGTWEGIKEAFSNFFNKGPTGPIRHFGSPFVNYGVLGFVRKEGEVGVNVYAASKTGEDWTWTNFWRLADREPRVEISLYGKTVWDVIKELQLVTPNYIAAVHPFDFRSTLFYGDPYWDFVYDYEMSRERPPGEEGKDYMRFQSDKDLDQRYHPDDLKENTYFKFKKKPYSQLHVYTSGDDILSNNIRASADVYTNAVAVYDKRL